MFSAAIQQDTIKSKFHSLLQSSTTEPSTHLNPINNDNTPLLVEPSRQEAIIVHPTEVYDPRPLFQRLQSLREKDEEDKEEFYKNQAKQKHAEDQEFLYLQLGIPFIINCLIL